MRAKLKIDSITKFPTCEEIIFSAVCATKFPSDGTDENNSFAKWTPSATLKMMITNPDLIGTFNPGQEFYLDFTLCN